MRIFPIIIVASVILLSGCTQLKINKCIDLCVGDSEIPVLRDSCRNICEKTYYYGGEAALDKRIKNLEKETKEEDIKTTTTTESEIAEKPKIDYFLYDDFSGDTLDSAKWSEDITSDISSQHLEEHYLDPINEVYRASQKNPADRGTILIMNRNISPGEIIEFDVNYISGSGNHESWVWLGADTYLMRGLNYFTECTTPTPGCGLIGYWNGVPDVGNTLGKYHVKVIYDKSKADVSFTRSDMSTITHRFRLKTYPNHKFGVVTRSGSDGICEFEYDNFKIGVI